ncbi:hypothetical protein ACJRO7_022846 [Eucalyptus globulus]|uniref:Glycosyltransferase 61 catalytic domain-containing protein n=1 Tax=Eucalyptus globulus TaxID=34317 RepID=A0ABD3K5Q7_EUCGL
MVHHRRFHQWRKGEAHIFDDEESHCRRKPKLFYLLVSLLFSLAASWWSLSCSVPGASLYSFSVDSEGARENHNANAPPCSSMSNGTICCDRSGFRSDLCIMKGDVRTHSPSSSVFLYHSKQQSKFIDFISIVHRAAKRHDDEELQHEKIRPYTRKWENPIMDKIDELDLIVNKDTMVAKHRCDVPALSFSTRGYTGNLYHEFNDRILPLYITSQHFKEEVVFVILEYHNWWIMKYENILSRLSNYPLLDFAGDKRTRCFPEAIVGSIPNKEQGVQLKLNQSASVPTLGRSMKINKDDQKHQVKKLKLVILSRSGSRALVNEDCLVKMAEDMGFRVKVSWPKRTTELAKMYRLLNKSEVMVGVHGAALTHFLFLKPGSVLIQVIPLGTDSPAETCFGKPARELGLKYIGHKISPRESSLYNEYDKDDPVLTNPKGVTRKGWQYTKEIYLDRQNVSLDMRRFHKRLLQAYDYSFKKINGQISYNQTTDLFKLC